MSENTPPSEKAPEVTENTGLRVYDFLIVGVICLSLVVIERLLERRFWPQVEFQSVNVQRIIQQEIEESSRIPMTPEDRQKRGARFAAALEKEIAALNTNGRLVLVTPAVVSGAVDRTEDVRAAILQDLK